jgi:hypothetical protein
MKFDNLQPFRSFPDAPSPAAAWIVQALNEPWLTHLFCREQENNRKTVPLDLENYVLKVTFKNVLLNVKRIT